VGQLNDRLDVETLITVVERGVRLTVVGPRCERREDTARALDRLLSMPSVTWTDRVPRAEVAAHLATAVVGLTPYRDTEFNRASFPLKTLEYLAAGVPVVSTDLPASSWLDTPFVDVTTTPTEFADRVEHRVREGRGVAVTAGCRAVAARHTWEARGEELAEMLLALVPPTPESAVLRGVHRVP